jgi:tRNA(fMet)-specific endonuclease VapC
MDQVSAPKYMLDTNICIYIRAKRPPAVLQRFRTLDAGSVVMSVITFGELWYGAAKSAHTKIAREALAALREFIPVLAVPPSAGEHYGEARASLEKSGAMIGNNDLWIAAHARAQNLIVVTHNTKEFDRIPSLTVEDWTQCPLSG